MNKLVIVSGYLRSYEKGDQKGINRYLHDDYVYYPPGGKTPLNREERIHSESRFFSAFRVLKISMEDRVSEGDKVAVRVAMECLHSGTYQGIAPTNKRIAITYLEILAIRDEKIYREWAEFDMLSILNQLQ